MTSVNTTCRDINELLPASQLACKLLFQECYKVGITNIFITETYRSQERQKYLYEQGRTRPGSIVTWTLDSNHKSRLAWDVAVGPPQLLYDVTTLNRIGSISRKLGITWGGDWIGSIDRPHFEVKSNWVIPKGYKLEGQVIVPTSSAVKVQLIVEVNKPTEKDDDKMEFTNKTTKAAVRDFIKQAVDKDIINKSWLDKFDNGTMTTGDYEGLKLIIAQRSN
ncbi:peptidoglycan L-alanyl-D-glutamate endopeptidase [Lysinibacillus sphaericus]|uniref:M15 family metallopeptidase n=1 Tax=Lysinibacillus sphaericus TaxID=1421 RepID=UPI0018CF5C06|nr:M15 family metallopeptidase [Lysinibacillus sphaericus]MBG9453317.1 peptidoglycan L-alanyl-D-glutamate endopeptidase [Lysinibacillus sphaericus]MBG9477079.1 peptidoglycan L-alanyl-D-glutamate endopeptidase [Lysinibacillus sphaericus]MBG9591161.1 peptidoglycan L-alanyl-D-glutamate endopeptidase [Lysinibacillus sphaericus]MBG9592021.1 peptidoglycan L-alanyl-D-glutamate endopeptidase [Lysinibacillus sphaericus]